MFKKKYYSFVRKNPFLHKTIKFFISPLIKREKRSSIITKIASDYSNKFFGEIKELRVKEERKKYYSNISIIILNYNNKDIVDKCIDSILNFNKNYNCKVVVVDNQSTDGSFEILQTKYRGNITLLRNEKNGCASGRNLGVSSVNTEYLIFLDSDQWVLHENWIDPFIEIFKEKEISAIGWAGGWLGPTGQASLSVDDMPNRYEPENNLYRSDIDYIGSGGMMMKTSLFNKIGGFDTNYDPTAYEDTDISFKIKNVGGKIVYSPYLGIGHLPHQTTKDGSKEHFERMKKNGEYFAKKWERLNPQLFESLVKN